MEDLRIRTIIFSVNRLLGVLCVVWTVYVTYTEGPGIDFGESISTKLALGDTVPYRLLARDWEEIAQMENYSLLPEQQKCQVKSLYFAAVIKQYWGDILDEGSYPKDRLFDFFTRLDDPCHQNVDPNAIGGIEALEAGEDPAPWFPMLNGAYWHLVDRGISDLNQIEQRWLPVFLRKEVAQSEVHFVKCDSKNNPTVLILNSGTVPRPDVCIQLQSARKVIASFNDQSLLSFVDWVIDFNQNSARYYATRFLIKVFIWPTSVVAVYITTLYVLLGRRRTWRLLSR